MHVLQNNHCIPSLYNPKENAAFTQTTEGITTLETTRKLPFHTAFHTTVSKHNTNICQLNFPIPLTAR